MEDFIEKSKAWQLFYTVNQRYPSQKSKELREKRLGQWQNYVRMCYKNTIQKGNNATRKLTQEKIDILNAIKGWKWKEESLFQKNVDKWKNFYIVNGRNPSITSNEPDEKHLALWQANTRSSYMNRIHSKSGKKLREEHIELLNMTEGWQWYKQNSFAQNLEEWIAFYKENQRYPSSHSWDLNERCLGLWQMNVRHNYKNTIRDKKTHKLSQKYIDILNATEGWQWNNPTPFPENLKRWKDFYNINKRAPCRTTKDPYENHLGRWQSHMRYLYKNTIEKRNGKTLLQKWINALNATKGWRW